MIILLCVAVSFEKKRFSKSLLSVAPSSQKGVKDPSPISIHLDMKQLPSFMFIYIQSRAPFTQRFFGTDF